MASKWVVCLLFLCISYAHSQNNIFRVTDYGAIADGETDSSQAFLDAWREACESNGGLVEVPQGTYCVRGANFEGPCNGKTFLTNNGTLIAPSDPSYGEEYWIQFSDVDGLTISGNGTFDGNGASAWSLCEESSKCRSFPSSIKFTKVMNGFVRGINSVNSKMFHLNINNCDGMQMDNVGISAPAGSPNTDGIHIGKSNNIMITNSHISTGDDCISIGDGNTDINITTIWCGPGHGISIGSLGKYETEKDVSGITVRNCTLTNTQNGLRIKTWATSIPVTVSDVTFTDIQVYDIKNPIIIDQYYCPHSSCSHEGDSEVEINGVKYINVRGSSASEVAVRVNCSKSRPCQNIEFAELHLTMTGTGQPTTASCSSSECEFIGPDQVPWLCSSPASPGNWHM